MPTCPTTIMTYLYIVEHPFHMKIPVLSMKHKTFPHLMLRGGPENQLLKWLLTLFLPHHAVQNNLPCAAVERLLVLKVTAFTTQKPFHREVLGMKPLPALITELPPARPWSSALRPFENTRMPHLHL